MGDRKKGPVRRPALDSPGVVLRQRSFQLAAASIAYVCVAGIEASGGVGFGLAAVVLLPLALGVAWSRVGPPPRGADRIDPAARSALRGALYGAALLVAARTAPAGRSGFDAAANAGAAIASVSALVALARVASPGGLLAPPPGTRRLDAAGFAALLWTIAVALPAAHALAPKRTVLVDPLAIDHATAAAGVGSLVVTAVAALRLHVARRLELGVGDRAKAALALAAAALAVALPAALLDLAPRDRILPAGAVAGALAVAFACTTSDPVTVSRAQRTILAVTLLGAPVALFGATVALRAPMHAPAVVLATAVVAIVVGLASRELARPLGPERSRWVEAIDAASVAALEPEPDRAVQATLMALRDAGDPDARGPALWRRSPADVIRVDRAGYVRAEPAVAPEELFAVAEQEPERTLREDVLGALEVRRADLRPLLAWMRGHEALSATVLSHEDGPIGVLVMPKGKRKAPLALEEVRALRRLADRLSAVLEVSSALARSRARELDERGRADAEEDRALHLAHLLDAAGARYETDARRLAREALVATYSPGARLAAEELERLGALGIPVTILAPLGVDPVPWAALAHLASARKTRPLVVVDGADPADQAIATWRDPVASPLATAEGGTLVLLGVEALPHETQTFLARALAERRSPSGRATPLDVALVVSVKGTVDALVASGRIAPELADWLGDRAVPLPPLSARSEDLRALVLDRLARLGMRSRGRPMGIDPRALAKLVAHVWPGNDLELLDVLTRAVKVASGEVVTAEDLDRIGFVAVEEEGRRTATRAAARRRRMG